MIWARLVLAIALVGGWTSTAAAQCAWLLWVKTAVLLPGDKTVSRITWDVGKVFKARANCQRARIEHWQELVRIAEADVGPANVNKKSGEYVTRFLEKGGHINEVLHCFPDTIDPR